MSHPWESKGEKRTIVAEYTPPDEVMKYIKDMQDIIRRALEVAYEMAISDHNRMPSPIDLRNEIKGWYKSHYDYATHHINPTCRAAVGMDTRVPAGGGR